MSNFHVHLVIVNRLDSLRAAYVKRNEDILIDADK